MASPEPKYLSPGIMKKIFFRERKTNYLTSGIHLTTRNVRQIILEVKWYQILVRMFGNDFLFKYEILLSFKDFKEKGSLQTTNRVTYCQCKTRSKNSGFI